MILADRDIRERQAYDNLIHPFDSTMVQPASVDLRLGDHFVWYPTQTARPIDLARIQETAGPDFQASLSCSEFYLRPQEFCLGQTKEWVNIPNDLVGQIEGKSSLARLGLIVHVTAGFLDPGFQGVVTLEFVNCNNRSIILRPGLPICQIAFSTLSQRAEFPYGSEILGSHYQYQNKTTPSLA